MLCSLCEDKWKMDDASEQISPLNMLPSTFCSYVKRGLSRPTMRCDAASKNDEFFMFNMFAHSPSKRERHKKLLHSDTFCIVCDKQAAAGSIMYTQKFCCPAAE